MLELSEVETVKNELKKKLLKEETMILDLTVNKT